MSPSGRIGRRPPRAVFVRRWIGLVAGVIVLVVLIVNLTSTDTKTSPPTHPRSLPRPLARFSPERAACPPVTSSLPGMPAVIDRCDIYSADRAGDLSPAARAARPLIYVPNSLNDTVDEIDPATDQIVREIGVGALPQHVVPSWDLKTLWVTNDQGNSLTPIDPVTGDPGQPVHVEDPYNMYFTPDGHDAIVVAEALQRLDFRDPHTMALVHSLPVPCRGVDHMDFSANGT